jgi:hypothetical protein
MPTWNFIERDLSHLMSDGGKLRFILHPTSPRRRCPRTSQTPVERNRQTDRLFGNHGHGARAYGRRYASGGSLYTAGS